MTKTHRHCPITGQSRTYRIWGGMLTRMRNPNHPSARRYREKELDFDPRWTRFEAFLSDMGECPENLTLDRIDNDAGYWPNNCRWAPRSVQSRNTCRNIWVILNNEKMVMKDALAIVGYSQQAYHYLKRTHGFSAQTVIDKYASKPKLSAELDV